jgi:hypothetical protein
LSPEVRPDFEVGGEVLVGVDEGRNPRFVEKVEKVVGMLELDDDMLGGVVLDVVIVLLLSGVEDVFSRSTAELLFTPGLQTNVVVAVSVTILPLISLSRFLDSHARWNIRVFAGDPAPADACRVLSSTTPICGPQPKLLGFDIPCFVSVSAIQPTNVEGSEHLTSGRIQQPT